MFIFIGLGKVGTEVEPMPSSEFTLMTQKYSGGLAHYFSGKEFPFA